MKNLTYVLGSQKEADDMFEVTIEGFVNAGKSDEILKVIRKNRIIVYRDKNNDIGCYEFIDGSIKHNVYGRNFEYVALSSNVGFEIQRYIKSGRYKDIVYIKLREEE